MGKTYIFLYTANSELSAIYSSFKAKFPFEWWRIPNPHCNNNNVFCRHSGSAVSIDMVNNTAHGGNPAWHRPHLLGIATPLCHGVEGSSLFLHIRASAIQNAANRQGHHPLNFRQNVVRSWQSGGNCSTGRHDNLVNGKCFCGGYEHIIPLCRIS